jgi:hypothetical protein
MSPLARALLDELRARPRHFGELVEAHMQTPWREFLLAWGELRTADVLGRDDAGRYVIRETPSLAVDAEARGAVRAPGRT